jgi:hypothetical protein
MEERININVSATNYDQSSDGIRSVLTKLEEMVHEEDGFLITDSEFAFGWHFYIVSVNKILVKKLAEQIGERFQELKGKGLEKKFLTWFSQQMQEKNLNVKFAIKEEMESSKYGIF